MLLRKTFTFQVEIDSSINPHYVIARLNVTTGLFTTQNPNEIN